MATVTPHPPRNLAEDNRRVRSPLTRLRSWIRSYVSLEGAGALALFLALWFWIHLVLDYGSFKLLGLDWVQDFHVAFRVSILLLLVAGVLAVIALKVLTRLFREFQDVAMALLLERKFPGLLGDRLITAVELCEPEKAAEQGYSVAMVREVIHEAADRVDQVPIREVFDWKRLITRALVVLALAAGGYLLVGGTFAAVNYSQNRASLAGFGDFNSVATIWFERNILLQNSYWPRRAQLEIIEPARTKFTVSSLVPLQAAGLPEDVLGKLKDLKDKEFGTRQAFEAELAKVLSQEEQGQWVSVIVRYSSSVEQAPAELRIGRDASLPNIRVRANKFVIADGDAVGGWRALTWADLDRRSELLELSGVLPVPPGDWKPRDSQRGLTVDEVEIHLNKFDVRSAVAGKTLPARWNVAAPETELGYRPLYWSDMTSERLGGVDVPVLTPEWDPRAWPTFGARTVALLAGNAGASALLTATSVAVGPRLGNLTLDEIEDQHERPDLADVRHALRRMQLLARLRDVLTRLEERSELPGMARTVRQLVIPKTVYLVYRGKNTSTRITLKKGSDNEYSGVFSDLKGDTVQYWAQAEDFTTPVRQITVLPPPSVVRLTCAQTRPAYLYYRAQGADAGKELRGKKQVFEDLDLSSVSSDVVTIEVPSGTDLVLKGESSKELSSVLIKPLKEGNYLQLPMDAFKDGDSIKARQGRSVVRGIVTDRGQSISIPQPMGMDAVKVPVSTLSVDDEIKVLSNGTSFQATFPDVRQIQAFKFILADKDNVKGERQILLRPKDDQAPELVDVMPEVVRKVKDVYMVSTQARIPFSGRIIDDNGLASVRFAYSLTRIEAGINVNVQALTTFLMAPGLAANPQTRLTAAATYLAGIKDGIKAREPDTSPASKQVVRQGLPAFQRKLDDKKDELLPMQRVKEMLAARQKLPHRVLVKDFTVKPDTWNNAEADALECDFPLWTLKLKEIEARKTQARYRLTLWMEAVDTDLESDREADGTPRPHTSRSKESFTFQVVSETELLAEISKEEELLHLKLEDVFNQLLEKEAVLSQGTLDLNDRKVEGKILLNVSEAMKGIDKFLEKGQGASLEIVTDYERIVKEMRINQVDPRLIERVSSTIVKPLKEIETFEFLRTREAITKFRTTLDEAFQKNNAAEFPGALTLAKNEGVQAREQLRSLKDALAKVLTAMAGLTDINKLVRMLRDIEEKERDQYDLIARIRKQIEEDLVREALKGLEKK